METPQTTLLPSSVSLFLSQIWSISSSSCLFDYLFSHQCQSSAVANVLSSSLVTDSVSKRCQRPFRPHKHVSIRSIPTDIQMLFWARTGDIHRADNPCPILWYALNVHNSVQSIKNTIYIVNNHHMNQSAPFRNVSTKRQQCKIQALQQPSIIVFLSFTSA